MSGAGGGFKPRKKKGIQRMPAGRAEGAAAPAKSFEQLVAEAEALVEQCDAEGAAALYAQAAKLHPDDVAVLDAWGAALFEAGDAAKARAVFTQSATLSPDVGHTKWMCLGQLLEGDAAVAAYTKGVSVLQTAVAATAAASAASGSAGPTPEEARLRREMSSGLTSLAELYMTDLCDEDDAETRCEQYATAAVAADATNAEAFQVFANLRLCQKRPADAVPLVSQAVALLEALDRDSGDADGAEDCGDEDDDEHGDVAMAAAAAAAARGKGRRKSVAAVAAAAAAPVVAADPAALAAAIAADLPPPTFDFQLATAKLCLEVEQYRLAAGLLERLLAEDDANMEVWYLSGEAYAGAGEPEAAAENLTAADRLLTTALALLAPRAKKAVKGKRTAAAAEAAGEEAAAAAGGAGSATAALPYDVQLAASPTVAELLRLGRAELEAQRTQIRKLLATLPSDAVAAGAAAGAVAIASTRAGGSGGAAGTSSHDADEDMS
jgi:tetratricopeptide (TPR) repeat protein